MAMFPNMTRYFRRVLNAAGKIVAPGVTTEEIDALVGTYHTNTEKIDA